MPYHFQGKTFESVPHSKLTPSEMDSIERITGMTYARIQRTIQTCLCEHGLIEHLHFDEETRKRLDDISCGHKDCPCGTFIADLPARVNYALLWVALRRIDPAVSFEDIEGLPQDEWQYESSADDAVDPTPPSDQEG